jgi:chromosome segregation ATPase
MKSWNRESRELKLRYDMKLAQVNLSFNQRQVQLSHEIDMAKNELHYCNQSMRQAGADVVALKSQLDAAVERIHDLSQKKVLLDFDRKNCLVALEREHAAEVDALEAKYNREEVVTL